ncbi:unnamed protein product, partial [Ectocarpus sp. 12 AP-2014]
TTVAKTKKDTNKSADGGAVSRAGAAGLGSTPVPGTGDRKRGGPVGGDSGVFSARPGAQGKSKKKAKVGASEPSSAVRVQVNLQAPARMGTSKVMARGGAPAVTPATSSSSLGVRPGGGSGAAIAIGGDGEGVGSAVSSGSSSNSKAKKGGSGAGGALKDKEKGG